MEKNSLTVLIKSFLVLERTGAQVNFLLYNFSVNQHWFNLAVTVQETFVTYIDFIALVD